ncbi:MAG: RNA polymerase II mediator complex component Srb8 [Lasallia pustulata]|uniref:Mediator of RNA polymerase II transcription subunit 12 n=1 Tax=Lasallia pustulata TaxID=136370 RepID=A0A5M8PG52_9LECA|nr:MAG: RNA polymerase II mediator complex component Srb8 [Lasallia pustulata]
MTSHPAVGFRRPPLPSSSSSFPRPPSRTTWHASPQLPRPASQQVAIKLTDASTSSRELLGPAYKRQKLEDGASSAGLTSPPLADGEQTHQACQQSIVGSPASLKINPATLNPLRVQDPRYAEDRSRSSLPFPIRPGKYAPRPPKGQRVDKAATRGDVQVKPYVVSVPTSAPHYSTGRPADFFPWTGNHAEDILTEQTTKTGFYEKTPVGQNETNSAKPSISTSLKHKSGLQILSSLFVSALDRRRAHGTVTANSTFKPPPRVTLTDTKREAWLRDLADPTIPLRRLSRTIPHGIRGKVLLDHCLHKDIPTGRAVWLAKCVGANEIRAFKRKGASGAFAVGGEAKWIREWTSHVEQFVESTIDSCGTANWKDLISYALRLSSQLFSEHLMDQDHYIDWMIASLHNSDLDNAPIWLLITQIHWKEILQYRRRGRRLAEALLEQLQRVHSHDGDEFLVPVQEQLVRLLNSFMTANPACFIIPSSWLKYEPLLRSCVVGEKATLISALEQISGRNLRLIRSRDKQFHHATKDARPELIAVLDNIPAAFNLHRTSKACLQVNGSRELLITTVLEWASSLYRRGQARIYAAVRLLRKWARLGIDIGRPILAFLAASPTIMGLEKDNIYRIIAELVRSKHFSVGKYLQWLLARGSLSGRHSLSPRDSCDARLLCELPLHDLPDHVLNLRRILLTSVGYSTDDEKAAGETAKASIVEQVPGLLPLSEPSTQALLPSFDEIPLSGTARWDLGRWIRKGIASRFQSYRNGPEPDAKATHVGDSKEATITVEELTKILEFLEHLEDFSILADVLCIVTDCEDARVLNVAVDTINRHIDIFAAIGAADDLFERFCQRRDEIHAQMPVMKSLVVSLIDLGENLSSQASLVRQLRKLVLSYERKFTIAACSPVSDHMAEALQSTESNFADELEQLLARGSSMDRQILSRLFETVMSRIGLPGDESVASVNLSELLTRLRLFDTRAFDQLMHDWLDKLLQSPVRPRLLDVLPTLICSGCTTLRAVVDQASLLLGVPGQNPKAEKLATDTLELLCSPAPLDHLSMHCQSVVQTPQRAYRFRREQECIIRTHPSQLVLIVRATIIACTEGPPLTQLRARTLISSSEVGSLLKDIMVRHPESMPELYQAFTAGPLVDHVKLAIDQLLDPGSEQDILHEDVDSQIVAIMQVANDFNLPFCQLKLKFTLRRPDATRLDSGQESVVPTLMDAIRSSIDRGSTVWARVIAVLEKSHTAQLREMAEAELLCYLTARTSAISSSLKQMTTTLEGLLAIVDVTNDGSVPDAGASDLFTHVVKTLDYVLSAFSSVASEAPTLELEESASVAKQQQLDVICLNIDVILRLLVIHHCTFSHLKSYQSNIVRLLLTLGSLLVHRGLTHNATLSTHIFDVLALLADSAADDTRATCIRILADQHQTRDPRLRFLFGYSDGIGGEGLQLTSSPTSSSSPRAAATTASEWQRGAADMTMRQPFPLKQWEMMQESTPIVGENDTSLSLGLFGARRAVLQL